MTTLTAPLYLDHLFDLRDLEQAIDDGYVRVQYHPTQPLVIYNYTEMCQYAGAWTPVTLTCRGLIARSDTHEVVARPYPKFFNHGQAGAATIGLNDPVLVTDKADGSLGIIYPLPFGGWAVATRGSFTSEQAVHATEVLRNRYASFRPTPGTTTLVEIVYPANRIVLDYDGLDDLILLGGVGIGDGAVYDPSWFGTWYGPIVEHFPAATFADALAMPPRPNAEGVVVRSLVDGGMVKIKQADYVALHRIVTGFNARVIWQHLMDGKPLADLIAPLPDEFHDWCKAVAYTLSKRVDEAEAAAQWVFGLILAQLPDEFPRRDFAALAAPHALRWALFNLLDGKDITAELWKRAKPEAGWTPTGRTYGEDAA
ncbi:RNA ligase [Micromonospora pisi]|uniref:RNA ligase n=1 Tax=Micromonospora pisi TaxID=589240 RepID=A0A495JUF4_9ACTN|nr:RNA ligase [Micromonospora pisi]RKR92640.1 RNA ligase [Micromonospora pisi]